jgi:hypothetical protein
MASYLCKVICTGCGALFEDLIEREFLHDGVDHDNGVMESINYRCDQRGSIVRIRRFYQSKPFESLDEIISADDKLNICPACQREVPSFGDRWHVELGNFDAVLKQPCPRCHRSDSLMFLERKEVTQ